MTRISLLALLLIGCGGSVGENTVDPMFGKADGVVRPATEAPTLAPGYALKMVSDVVVRDTEADEVSQTHTEVMALVRAHQEGRDVELEIAPCNATLPEVAGRQPSVDFEVLRKATPATVRAGLVATEDGERLVTEKGAIVLGADPANPVTDPLPTSQRDPEVDDIDEDGKPGITIKVSGFRIYAAVRASFGLEGALDSTGNILGTAGMSLELKVFGDSIPFVDVEERINDAAAVSEVLEERHAFALVPLAEADLHCDALDAALAPVVPDVDGVVTTPVTFD